MQRRREVPDFAWRRDRRPAFEVTGGDSARDITKLDDRPRHTPRKEVGEEQGADDRDQAGHEHVPPRPRHDVTESDRADRDPHEAEGVSNGDVQFFIARGRAATMADAHHAPPRRDDLRTTGMILEMLELLAIEARITDHDA